MHIETLSTNLGAEFLTLISEIKHNLMQSGKHS